MKLIALKNGRFAKVDDEDHEYLNQWEWSSRRIKNRGTYYVFRREYINGKRKTILMHRELMNPSKTEVVDHINHDGEDNQRFNLRVCSNLENCWNNISNKGRSKYKGIAFHERIQKWEAKITVNRKRHYLGVFNDEISAALAYNDAAIKYFGEFACLNEIEIPEGFVREIYEIKPMKKTSKYKGVGWNAEHKRWKATLYLNKKQIHLGFHDTELQAAISYNLACLQYSLPPNKYNNLDKEIPQYDPTICF